jgi:hypothetical protein
MMFRMDFIYLKKVFRNWQLIQWLAFSELVYFFSFGFIIMAKDGKILGDIFWPEQAIPFLNSVGMYLFLDEDQFKDNILDN